VTRIQRLGVLPDAWARDVAGILQEVFAFGDS